MYELTLQQTDTIVKYVKRHQIVFSHLCDDIIDHLCCDLEESIRNGTDFDEAFSRLKMEIGKNGITSIQEETLYAVDSKYRKMKNTMKISGVIGTVLLGISSVFKIQHWPLGGAILILGAFILIALFLPSSLMVLWKESKSGKRLYLFLAAFLASAFFIAGVIFKVQHWPGSNTVLTIGILMSLFLLLPAMVGITLNNPDNSTPRWITISGALVIGMFGAGFLCKTMHWPGASILLAISILLIAVLVVPSYFYHKWKNDDHVSLEAIFIIFVIVMFIVPAAIVSLNTSRNFGSLFWKVSSLDYRNLELRVERNMDLKSTIDFNEISELAELNSITTNLINDINTIENRIIKSFDENKLSLYKGESNIDDQIFNYYNSNQFIDNDEAMVSSLKTSLEQYSSMIETLNMDYANRFQSELLYMDKYFPEFRNSNGNRFRRAPIVLIQGFETLKGAILDAEALTLRNYANNTNQSN